MRSTEKKQNSILLQTSKISLEIQPLGAMIGPARFILPGGKDINPFFVAPWCDDNDNPCYASLPPLLKKLRGEWPCVPFGRTIRPEGLKDEWKIKTSVESISGETNPHGISSNSEWDLEKQNDNSLICRLKYPEDHPVEWLERRVVLSEKRPKIYLSLTIHARQNAFLPIGLHPVFSLPITPAAAQISVCKNARAWTFPVDIQSDRSWFQADQRNIKLDELVNRNGETDSINYLPFIEPSEDLVLLSGTEGKVKLDHTEEGYSTLLQWDAEILPSCLLWISCGGRDYYPWNGRVRAIGIEPIAAPFDLGITQSDDPLSTAGISTGIQLDPTNPLTINYSVSLQEI
ncbi:hypothetical protein [Kiloniella sp. EL199]|uniref:hypothetical protein n=1 Tax=Kiloniella sp. EL199 TaxID=2107581 RepID=UPI000EA1735B|nr:hypothetical protein [Kiloniella sp. EL199]